MVRIILFLLLIGLAAAGAAWVADQTGDVVLLWGGVRVTSRFPRWRSARPSSRRWCCGRSCARCGACRKRSARRSRERRQRAAAMPSPTGCSRSAMAMWRRARATRSCARKHAGDDPLALLLHAQSAQLAVIATARRGAFRPWPSATTRGSWACAVCSSRRSATTIRLPR